MVRQGHLTQKSGPGVKGPVDFLEVFTVDMGVDFRGGDIEWPKFLESTDIHSALQKMGGERVTDVCGWRLGHRQG